MINIAQIYEELDRRNYDALAGYNSGKIIHQKQLNFHKSQKQNRWVFGGNRTSKTECGAVETIWLAEEIILIDEPNQMWLVGLLACQPKAGFFCLNKMLANNSCFMYNEFTG